jgi:hypothetical protein
MAYQNRAITKPINGWNPPDTNELEKLCSLLDQVGRRIHALKIACQLNGAKEDGRERRFIASRKMAIEKARNSRKRMRRS